MVGQEPMTKYFNLESKEIPPRIVENINQYIEDRIEVYRLGARFFPRGEPVNTTETRSLLEMEARPNLIKNLPRER